MRPQPGRISNTKLTVRIHRNRCKSISGADRIRFSGEAAQQRWRNPAGKALQSRSCRTGSPSSPHRGGNCWCSNLYRSRPAPRQTQQYRDGRSGHPPDDGGLGFAEPIHLRGLGESDRRGHRARVEAVDQLDRELPGRVDESSLGQGRDPDRSRRRVLREHPARRGDGRRDRVRLGGFVSERVFRHG